MGSLTLNKIDRLFWMGRYAERVNTTLRFMMDYYDKLIDDVQMPHADVCERLAIPDVYSSDADFSRKFIFDGTNPDSLAVAADRMLGNSMTLRETIGTDTLSYLQMAVNELGHAEKSSAPMVVLQHVMDYIMAFRGNFDDRIIDESTRNIIKCGFNVEKLSLCLRLGYPDSQCVTEIGKLLSRLRNTPVRTRSAAFASLLEYADISDAGGKLPEDRSALITAAEEIIDV